MWQAARAAGINSISFDLVYGLPIQSQETFAATLERVPSLLSQTVTALFNYAYSSASAQRRIPTETLPTIQQRIELFPTPPTSGGCGLYQSN